MCACTHYPLPTPMAHHFPTLLKTKGWILHHPSATNDNSRQHSYNEIVSHLSRAGVVLAQKIFNVLFIEADDYIVARKRLQAYLYDTTRIWRCTFPQGYAYEHCLYVVSIKAMPALPPEC